MKTKSETHLELLRSWLHGAKVGVATQTGERVGKLIDILFDQKEILLKGLVFKKNFFSDEMYVPFSKVTGGKDVILFDEAVPLTSIQNKYWVSLRDLRNRWVTSNSGEHLGHFLDLETDSQGRVARFWFQNTASLPLTQGDVNFGRDEIIVSADAVKRIDWSTSLKDRGLLSRVWGPSKVTRFVNQMMSVPSFMKSESKDRLEPRLKKASKDRKEMTA